MNTLMSDPGVTLSHPISESRKEALKKQRAKRYMPTATSGEFQKETRKQLHTSYWSEPNHKATLSLKGCWEMLYFVDSHSPANNSSTMRVKECENWG